MDDLIRRQDAIDALNEVSEHYTDKGREWHPHVNFMVDAIRDLPSAQSERKTGRWIAHDLSIKDVPTECCSECCEWSYGWHEKYCPKCGSPMEVEHEND